MAPQGRGVYLHQKDGIHVIDLAKTKAGLEKAVAFIHELTKNGGEVLFVATKRQAQGVVKQEAEAVGAPYFIQRWIGGFFDQLGPGPEKYRKNQPDDRRAGKRRMEKFPKHEQTKLGHYLKRLKVYYGGVLVFKNIPQALFIVDIKKKHQQWQKPSAGACRLSQLSIPMQIRRESIT